MHPELHGQLRSLVLFDMPHLIPMSLPLQLHLYIVLFLRYCHWSTKIKHVT